ncbi:hypothetical protein B0H12DRAFT_1152935 [Mycena haematopus]|nr:hypothetical protein B0H12DRAFT_1152935 [Mycena haematopus]
MVFDSNGGCSISDHISKDNSWLGSTASREKRCNAPIDDGSQRKSARAGKIGSRKFFISWNSSHPGPRILLESEKSSRPLVHMTDARGIFIEHDKVVCRQLASGGFCSEIGVYNISYASGGSSFMMVSSWSIDLHSASRAALKMFRDTRARFARVFVSVEDIVPWPGREM